MGSLCEKSSTYEDQHQRNKSQEIEAQLQLDRLELESQRKLLLLGAADAGKSTIMKQMRILHDEGFSETEIRHQKFVIHYNIIHSMAAIIQAMKKLGIQFADPSLEEYGTCIVDASESNADVVFTPELQECLIGLWKDEGIKQAFSRSNEYQLNDSVEYFFNELERVGTEDYVPTQSDILHARVRTTGIVELKFKIKDLNLRVVDVGGQRSERKKWIQCFDDVSGIIFVTSLSEYDQKLREDYTTNRMQESLKLWSYISNHALFVNVAMILFLNKKDLFRQKIARVPLIHTFPDYKGCTKDLGAENYDEAVEFVRTNFETLCTNPSQTIYTHETCATDTEQVKFVLGATLDIIMKDNMLSAGMG